MRNHMLLMSFDDSSLRTLFKAIDYFLEYTVEILQKKSKIRFCYIGTARNDYFVDHLFYSGFLRFKFGKRVKTSRLVLHKYTDHKYLEEHLSKQDILFIGGGNTEEMLNVWENKGFIKTLNKLRDEDKLPICAGVSAGGMYPFHSGLTDSQPHHYKPLRCLEWIQHSFCPHANSKRLARCSYDNNKEHERLSAFHTAIKLGHLPPGYAVPDGCMLHFYNGQLITALSSIQDHKCMFVSPDSITHINTRHLNKNNIKQQVADVLRDLNLIESTSTPSEPISSRILDYVRPGLNVIGKTFKLLF